MQGIEDRHKLSESSKLRLDHAITYVEDSDIVVTSSGYTVHLPPILDKSGQPVAEADVGAQYLKEKGIPGDRIFSEKFSLDTIGNAFLVRQLYLATLPVTDVLVVSSAFHGRRVKEVFQWIIKLQPEIMLDTLDFSWSADPKLTKKERELLLLREETSWKNVVQLRQQIKTLNAFVTWLSHHHDAYAFDRSPKTCPPLISKSYRK